MTTHESISNSPEAEISESEYLKRAILTELYSEDSSLCKLVDSQISNFDEIRENAESESAVLEAAAEALKQSGKSDVVRWIEQGNLAPLSEEQQAQAYEFADMLGLRIDVDSELPNIENAVVVAEGGANRQANVRRDLALQLMPAGTIYQLGSITRQIAPTRTKDGEEVPNAEYGVIQAPDICGDLGGRTVTEHEVELMSAINAGYEKVAESENSVTLVKDESELVIIKAKSLADGIEQLAKAGVLDGQNIAITTNQQYTVKDEIQAERAMLESGVKPNSIVAVGDETGKRGANIYRAEIATVLRELAK